MIFYVLHCHTAATDTVDELAIVGRLDVVSAIVPISAVHTLLEEFNPLKIITSLPSDPGAQP